MEKKPIYLLMAEDDEDDVYLFRQAVADCGLPIEVVAAYDVPQALDQLNKITPSIIVIDVILPPSNGLELLELIRRNKTLDNIPVIMFSSAKNKQYIDVSLKQGANLYIIKPETYELLLQVVNKVYATSVSGTTSSTPDLFSV